jgi:membrane carboxypeptidase/penicillin-binding protein
VWLGFDRPKSIASGAAGGTFAAPIFGQMMARWGGLTSEPWATPSNVVAVELDKTTGDIAEDSLPADRRYTEFFIAGTEPPALRVDARRLFRHGPLIGF